MGDLCFGNVYNVFCKCTKMLASRNIIAEFKCGLLIFPMKNKGNIDLLNTLILYLE